MDPRDHVFALLGIKDHPLSPKEHGERPVPDYTKSVKDVYLDAVTMTLRSFGDLRPLSLVEDQF